MEKTFEGKLLIITAPSGAGKTTIVHHLLDTFPQLAFSVSATSRALRVNEREGRDYYHLPAGRFQELIAEGAFLEWQEVYAGQYYGTLLSEVDRLWAAGKHIVFDIDVKGALNLKENFPERTLSIFIKPPSREVLTERLRNRKTESPEQLQKRIEKAELELGFENQFDVVLVNDVLERALREAERIVSGFLGIER
ncbi:MAG: guanylate kinase [Saprospirales bacterium]|nr:guanylate kinase [Saprospirales bacterium]